MGTYTPIQYALQFISRISFEKPRFAKLCSTKYEVGADNVGRIVIDQVIGITAIQGHTVANSAESYRLLGWRKVDQSFTGIHIFHGYHQTSHTNARKILNSEGIFSGGPSHVPRGYKGIRDCVYCSCNDPTAVATSAMKRGATSVSASGTIFIDGLMRPIPAHKYLDEGCTILFDFISWQEDHRYVSCFLTAANCLMIPALVESCYIIMIWDHEGTIIHHNIKRWDRSIEVMRQKYLEPPPDVRALPPPGFSAPLKPPLQPVGPAPVIRHQESYSQ